jgi:hypothetical protein
MKNILRALLATCLLLALPTLAEETFPTGTIFFQDLNVHQALTVYEKIAGLSLEMSADVKRSDARITLKNDKPCTRTELVKLLEKAFSEQAHITISKLDDKRAAVTIQEQKIKKP